MSTGRQLTSPTPKVNRLSIVAPVNKGGTGGTNSTDAAAGLGAIANSSIGQPGGPAQVQAGGQVSLSNYPKSFPQGAMISGPADFFIGGTHVMTITNYDTASEASYNVAVSAGTVSRDGATITFVAPATVGTVDFTIGSRTVKLTIKNTDPIQPSIISPVYGAKDIGSSYLAYSSTFQIPTGTPNHYSSDWEMATDDQFTNVVASSFNDQVNKTTWPLYNLQISKTYFLRVRHRDLTNGYSQWSNAGSFTTRASFYQITKEEAVLQNADGVALDQFGYRIAITDAGDRMIVSAPGKANGGITNAGATYIFVRSGSTWSQEAKLLPNTTVASSDQYGYSVDIDSTGVRAVVAMPYYDNPSPTDVGIVFIYLRSGSNWTLEQRFQASVPQFDARFGYVVKFDLNATRLICGGYGEDQTSPTTIVNCGYAYIWSRSGTTWSQEAKLQALDPKENDIFGNYVDITSDGTRALICAWGKTVGNVSNCGGAYVFIRSGTTWTQEAFLASPKPNAGDAFGFVGKINDSGDIAFIGTSSGSLNGRAPGAVEIFKRSGTTWTFAQRLQPADMSRVLVFGWTLDISQFGTMLAVSSSDDVNTANSFYSSRVWLWRLNTNTGLWEEQYSVVSSDKIQGDGFGDSLCLTADGTRMVVSSWVKNQRRGAAYVFSA